MRDLLRSVLKPLRFAFGCDFRQRGNGCLEASSAASASSGTTVLDSSIVAAEAACCSCVHPVQGRRNEGQSLLLVLLRAVEEATLVRRCAQNDNLQTGQICGSGRRVCMAVWMQADQNRSALWWLTQSVPAGCRCHARL